MPVRLVDQAPASDDMASEVCAGLQAADKHISPKFFYDHAGSSLFARITRLPEYYLTRTEAHILRRSMHEIAQYTTSRSQGASSAPVLVECGSASGEKARALIKGLTPRAYVGIDISRETLVTGCEAIADDFPGLEVCAICTDYSRGWELSSLLDTSAPVLAFFLGSSLGNFEPDEAVDFLSGVRRALRNNGSLLIGVDPPKAPAVLEAAYNDSDGVTAEFNLNLLAHLNRELGANFDLSAFEHRAVYNRQQQRIEMSLVSRRHQLVRLKGCEIAVSEGEAIHTENSYKYCYDKFVDMAWRAGYQRTHHWSDEAGLFSVFLLSP